ncbi:hypothetical protein D3C71_1815780 [compost metagenome]
MACREPRQQTTHDDGCDYVERQTAAQPIEELGVVFCIRCDKNLQRRCGVSRGSAKAQGVELGIVVTPDPENTLLLGAKNNATLHIEVGC